jgi:heme-degrading monooxygenase HmoA
MSVMVITRFAVPVSKFEELIAGKHHDTLLRAAEDGKAKGAIHHQVVEDTDQSFLVVDEWETEEAFHAFFDNQQDIQAAMADAGVREPPTTVSHRILDTPDRF